MGLFDWLRAKPVEVTYVWLTKDVKYAAIKRRAAIALANGKHRSVVVIVAQFPDCRSELKEVSFDDGRFFLALAKDVGQLDRQLPVGTDELFLIVAEMHQLRSHDAHITEVASDRLSTATVEFHVSLDDAVMRVKGGDWVVKALRLLGMHEHEAIQSPTVTKQIRKLQDWIGHHSSSDSSAASAQEWLDCNLTGS